MTAVAALALRGDPRSDPTARADVGIGPLAADPRAGSEARPAPDPRIERRTGGPPAAETTMASVPPGAPGAPQRLPPATTFPAQRDGVRVLAVDPSSGAIAESRMDRLPDLLRAGDLLVVNDAATLPASLAGYDELGHPIELRLAGRHADGRFTAVLFGAGDWRMRTEHRPPPPRLAVGARLRFPELARSGAGGRPWAANDGAPGLEAEVVARSRLSGRLHEVRFDRAGDALWAALYRLARPVQYAHVAHDLPLWAVQNVYAGRPWSFEMPSAGRALSWQVLLELRRRGIGLARLTHAAGLSATGDPDLDARLPLPEPYEIPPDTVAAVERARLHGGRVVAVGTTVVRALEGAALAAGGAPGPILRAGAGETDLRIGPDHRLRVVHGLLSGLHDPEESHFQLLRAFAPDAVLRAAHAHALAHGFHSHELGDATLILPDLGLAGEEDGGPR